MAHGAGALIGALTGFAITLPNRRVFFVAGLDVILLFGLWAATLGRTMVNLSGRAGFEEGKWGYDALIANNNQDAVRWLRDAAKLQPKVSAYWCDLGIAYERVGNMSAAKGAYQRAHELEPNNLEYSEASEKN